MARSRQNANQVPTIEATPIGGVTPAAGAFTTLGATGNATLAGTTALTGPISLGGTPGVAGQIIRSAGAGVPGAWGNALVQGAFQITTSGTSIEFNGVIPSWARRITVMFSGVSTSGTSGLQIQIGPSGGVETTGYAGLTLAAAAASAGVNSYTSGFVLTTGTDAATSTRSGAVTITNLADLTWVATGGIADTVGLRAVSIQYAKTIAAALGRLRITTINGTDTFDGGVINIMWE